jgi:hypothetical protein
VELTEYSLVRRQHTLVRRQHVIGQTSARSLVRRQHVIGQTSARHWSDVSTPLVRRKHVIGQTSARKIDKRDPENPIPLSFCTMPVKLDFPDRNTRIHFEKTLRKHCGLRATMSLPFQIRKYQNLFLRAMRSRYEGRIISAQPDTSTMSFVAFMKGGDSSGWSRCQESLPIPRGIMLPDFVIPNRVDLPGVTESGIGDDDEALLIEASINAESQP